MKKRMLGLSLFLGLVGFVTADAGGSDVEHYSMMGNMMTGHYGYGGMGFGWVMGLLFLTVLVLLIIWLSKQIWKK